MTWARLALVLVALLLAFTLWTFWAWHRYQQSLDAFLEELELERWEER